MLAEAVARATPRGAISTRIVGVLFVLAVVLVQAAALPDAKTCAVLVITSPRDGWRLSVMPDGSGRVNYAALPQTVEAPAGTIDFHELHSALTERTRTTSADPDAGTVECRSSHGEVQGTVMYLSDEPFAARQFERAWSAVRPASSSIGKEHADMLREMWNRRAKPR